ncbi:MAG: STAS domain protein [Methanosaeta sp. PtaU1.Bin028]|nr:MAG: STAS domain protein [Methanosaeta sp. PtaU1.Bin028]
MEIREKAIGDVYIVSIEGRMDTANSKDVESRLDQVIGDKREKMLIDLAGVDYISSVGLRVLLASLKRHRERRGKMALISLQPFVQDVFRITGLEKIFPIYSSEAEAMACFKPNDAENCSNP